MGAQVDASSGADSARDTRPGLVLPEHNGRRGGCCTEIDGATVRARLGISDGFEAPETFLPKDAACAALPHHHSPSRASLLLATFLRSGHESADSRFSSVSSEGGGSELSSDTRGELPRTPRGFDRITCPRSVGSGLRVRAGSQCSVSSRSIGQTSPGAQGFERGTTNPSLAGGSVAHEREARSRSLAWSQEESASECSEFPSETVVFSPAQERRERTLSGCPAVEGVGFDRVRELRITSI